MSVRTERVAGEVQQALGRLFQRDFADLVDGLLTVTRVKMAPDLRSGRVYLSILGGTLEPEAALKKIKAAAPSIRSAIGREVRLRVTPEMFYYIDDTQEEVSRVEDIFRTIQLERKRAEAAQSLASDNGEDHEDLNADVPDAEESQGDESGADKAAEDRLGADDPMKDA